jgi:hypothetical protein
LLRQAWRSGTVPTPSITAITTHSLPALRAFVDGEAEIAKSDWHSAAADFRTAFEADSTFWLAYWRYAHARNWYGGSVDSTVRQAYQRHRDQLPERERLLVEAGMDSSASARVADQRAVAQRFPEYLPGAFTYADNLFHSGGFYGYSVADTRAALDRAASLNATFTPAFEHRFWLEVTTLDTAAARRDLATLDALGYSGEENLTLPLLLTCRYGLSTLTGSADAPKLRDSLVAAAATLSASGWGAFVGGIVMFFSFPRQQIEVNDLLLRRAGPALSVPAREGTAFAWAERGAWDSALAVTDRLVGDAPNARTASDDYGLAVVGEWLGEPPAGSAEARRAAAERLTTSDADARADLAWLEGVSAATRGDGAALERARQAVRAAHVPAGAALDGSLGAFTLSLEGNRRAAADSLADLEWATADHPYQGRGRHPFLVAVDRGAAARWLLALGDTAQAERLMRFHEVVIVNLRLQLVDNALSTEVLLDQARIAEAHDETDLARTYYRMFLWRYDRPSPAHRARVDSARAGLARLGAGTE